MKLFYFLTALPLLAADPSTRPLGDVTGVRTYVERWRILVDLEGDGTRDLILSDGPHSFGNAGGDWTVYLQREGDFHRVGHIFAHPKAIAFEPDQGRSAPESPRYARIWTFSRGSGRSGMLGYYRVGESSVDEERSIEIYPGDGGTALGNAIYDATFKQSPIPFVLEHSSTDEDGHVTWTPARH